MAGNPKRRAPAATPKPPEPLAKMTWAMFERFEKQAVAENRALKAICKAAAVPWRNYYRWRAWAGMYEKVPPKDRPAPPALIGLYRLCEAAGLRLRVGGVTYSGGQELQEVATMDPDLAEIDAAMEGMEQSDRDRIVKMVQRYAANRVPPRPQAPARASGPARGRVRS